MISVAFRSREKGDFSRERKTTMGAVASQMHSSCLTPVSSGHCVLLGLLVSNLSAFEESRFASEGNPPAAAFGLPDAA